ncbi:MAG: 50S ribosomal protein L21 [Patescibacteria group bacterium]|nr:50S ribosomal protein L21 [Patescibacteria group bacterium]
MIAIIETGGKQYKVSPNQKIKIEKIKVGADGKVVFDKVLLVADGDKVEVGAPYLTGRIAEGKLIKEGRGEKKIIFRFHSKTRYRKKKGHRQEYSEVEISKI